ncbi:hypothetical protein [Sphingobacterium suaedae]|uniref:DUF4919 domain-containing protein n=1 Tax=Sphingobacterium suaedae TaxID=1686402 RepID=A0ABW5KGC9_9SPHI
MFAKPFLIIIYVFSLFGTNANAQTKRLEFADELCTYRGIYNDKKYAEKQLLDTYRLVRGNFYVNDDGDLDEVSNRFDSVIRSVNGLDVVPHTYFQQLRRDVLRYIREIYALKKIQKRAKEDPCALLSAVPTNKNGRYYAQALVQNGNSLLRAYEVLVKDQMKTNGYPEYLWEAYLENLGSPNKHELAFDYVLVYGWWNNVNHAVHHINYDGSQFEQFKKLFVRVETLDCDEP